MYECPAACASCASGVRLASTFASVLQYLSPAASCICSLSHLYKGKNQRDLCPLAMSNCVPLSGLEACIVHMESPEPAAQLELMLKITDMMIRLLQHSSLSQAAPIYNPGQDPTPLHEGMPGQAPTPSQWSSIKATGLHLFSVLDWISHQKAAALDRRLVDLTSLTSKLGLLLSKLLYPYLCNMKLDMQQICR